jgi:hypothetical protein
LEEKQKTHRPIYLDLWLHEILPLCICGPVTGRNCWKAEKIFFKRSVVTGRAEKPIRK